MRVWTLAERNIIDSVADFRRLHCINGSRIVRSIAFAMLLLAVAPLARAGDGENIESCVNKASEFTGVALNGFDASYEGNVFSLSIAKWKNARCEVKLGAVYNLEIDGRHVIFKGYAGKESHALKTALEEKTEVAINKLKARIAILEQRMEQTSDMLRKPKPDHARLSRFIDEGIEKSFGAE